VGDVQVIGRIVLEMRAQFAARLGMANTRKLVGEPPMDTLEQRVTRIEERMATKEDFGA